MSHTQKYRHESTPSEQLRQALAELEEQKTITIRRADTFALAGKKMAEQRKEIERLNAENEALKQELARRESNEGKRPSAADIFEKMVEQQRGLKAIRDMQELMKDPNLLLVQPELDWSYYTTVTSNSTGGKP